MWILSRTIGSFQRNFTQTNKYCIVVYSLHYFSKLILSSGFYFEFLVQIVKYFRVMNCPSLTKFENNPIIDLWFYPFCSLGNTHFTNEQILLGTGGVYASMVEPLILFQDDGKHLVLTYNDQTDDFYKHLLSWSIL